MAGEFFKLDIEIGCEAVAWKAAENIFAVEILTPGGKKFQPSLSVLPFRRNEISNFEATRACYTCAKKLMTP